MTPIEQCPQIYQTLAVHVARLSALLREPEPGLYTWGDFVAGEVAAIAKLYCGPHPFSPGAGVTRDDNPTRCIQCGATRAHPIHPEWEWFWEGKMKTRRPSFKEQSMQCANWNARHPVGWPVTVEMDSGEIRATKTVTPARMLPGNNLAVINLEGISGWCLLSRVRAKLILTEEAAPDA
jgi:hypothetical protein